MEEYYRNSFGYIETGLSLILTPANFGKISFSDFNEFFGLEDFYMVDKEKESAINQIIAADINQFKENFRKYNKDSEINVSGRFDTFISPQIISIEYTVLDKDKTIRKNITTMIDIENCRKIRLTDIIDADVLLNIIRKNGLIHNIPMPDSELLRLFNSSDDLNAPFSTNTGIFCTLYERSLCIYFQPEFFGSNPTTEEDHIYVLLDYILPYLNNNYWSYESKAAEHFEWKG